MAASGRTPATRGQRRPIARRHVLARSLRFRPSLPGADAWRRTLRQAAALATRLDVTVLSQDGRIPEVRMSLRVAGRTRCEPLVPWSSPTAPTP